MTNRIVNGILTLSSVGIIICFVLKMQHMPMGHQVSVISFLVFSVVYPIQFYVMNNKNTMAYIRFIVIWGICLVYLYTMFGGDISFLYHLLGTPA